MLGILMESEENNLQPKRRVEIMALGNVIDGKAQRVKVEDMWLSLIRVGEAIYAIGDKCSHANYSLSEGPVDAEELTIECWKHGAQFSLCDGSPVSLPATQPIPIFEVETDEKNVYVMIPEGRD
jgi:3-phenylpropionate/trans-cinnamate dioxygenase ferredoxin subunit